LRTLLLAGLVTAVVGCGGASGPLGPVYATPAAFARHIDSLYEGAGPYGNPQGTSRGQFLSWLEYSAAFGGTPSHISVSTGSGKETWNAYVWAIVDTNVSTAIFVVVAYRDANVSEAFLADVQTGPNFSGGQASAFVLHNGVDAVADSGQISFNSNPASGSCTPATGLQNPDIVLADTYKCLMTSYTISVRATGQGVLNGKSSETISFELTNVPGPLLESTGDA
jgi:hypothetical protein